MFEVFLCLQLALGLSLEMNSMFGLKVTSKTDLREKKIIKHLFQINVESIKKRKSYSKPINNFESDTGLCRLNESPISIISSQKRKERQNTNRYNYAR